MARILLYSRLQTLLLELGSPTPLTGLDPSFDPVEESVVRIGLEFVFKPAAGLGIELELVGLVGMEPGFVGKVVPGHMVFRYPRVADNAGGWCVERGIYIRYTYRGVGGGTGV